MGLDMYLHAAKRFPVASTEAGQILAAAGVTLDHLRDLSADPDRGDLYLWSTQARPDDSQPVSADSDVAAIAGLEAIRDLDSYSGVSVSAEGDRIAVEVTAIYWRKANAIHAWFVDNCQGGVDECQESDPIDVEQLMYLRHLCEQDAKAYADGRVEELTLIPRSGFFFGSTDIDEWWALDLAETVAAIDRVVPVAIAAKGVTFTYHSSW